MSVSRLFHRRLISYRGRAGLRTRLLPEGRLPKTRRRRTSRRLRGGSSALPTTTTTTPGSPPRRTATTPKPLQPLWTTTMPGHRRSPRMTKTPCSIPAPWPQCLRWTTSRSTLRSTLFPLVRCLKFPGRCWAVTSSSPSTRRVPSTIPLASGSTGATRI